MNTIRTIFIFFTTIFLASCIQPQAAAPEVQLSVMAPAQVTQSVPLELTLEFKNIGITDANISTMPQGTMVIESLTRDGIAIIPRQSEAYYIDGLMKIIDNSLKGLAPGESLTTQWTAFMDPVQNAYTIQAVQPGLYGAHPTWLFAINTPGNYSLAIYYQYPQSSRLGNKLFRGRTNTVVVSFTVIP